MAKPSTGFRISGGAGPVTIHATALVVGERGIVIRGASGSGKSTLARDLILEAGRDGRFARLVGDDRVVLTARHGRLVARPHPAIAGRLEIRGIGIAEVAVAAACVVSLVVDLDKDRPRMPEPGGRETCLLGVRLPRLAARPREAASLIAWQLRVADDTFVNVE